MKVRDYIVHETERQSGTHNEALGMYLAWDRLSKRLAVHKFRLIERDLVISVNLINGIERYREVPAVFNQGTPAIDASLVPVAMKRLGDQLNAPPFVDDKRQYADLMTREFLTIHPFADGNGRVGSLMWNYLMGTIDNPEPMPYYFGTE